MAFAVYGMAVVVAPAIGPTIGGWITDNYSWRWIFYINVPISLISLYLTHRLVEDPPYLKQEKNAAKAFPWTTSASAWSPWASAACNWSSIKGRKPTGFPPTGSPHC